jgi:hypothetical protein
MASSLPYWLRKSRVLDFERLSRLAGQERISTYGT